MLFINTVCEDFLSEVVVEKIIGSFGDSFKICNQFITDGNGKMKRGLEGYNRASAHIPFCVVTDLDDEECAPTLINKWRNGLQLHQDLIFRVAVREIEAWIMSDRHAFSRFSGIPLKSIPIDLEKVDDPKRVLLYLIEQYGKRAVREELLPVGGFATVGPGYNLALAEFVYDSWDPNQARKNSDSLQRMISHLQTYT